MCLSTVAEKIAEIMGLEVSDAVGHRAFPSLAALVAGNIMNTTNVNPEETTFAEAENPAAHPLTLHHPKFHNEGY